MAVSHDTPFLVVIGGLYAVLAVVVIVLSFAFEWAHTLLAPDTPDLVESTAGTIRWLALIGAGVSIVLFAVIWATINGIDRLYRFMRTPPAARS